VALTPTPTPCGRCSPTPSAAAASGSSACDLGGFGAEVEALWPLLEEPGTHLDGLNHLQIGDRGYNGWPVVALAGPSGSCCLGAETIPQIVTRGWLIDVTAVRGVDRLAPGAVITTEDVHEALDGHDPEPGDALLFHTGWGAHWTDPDRYLAGEPGPGLELAHWIASRGAALTGCDTWSYGPVPAENPARPFEVPQMLNVSPRRVCGREPGHKRAGGWSGARVRVHPHPSQAPRSDRCLGVADRDRLNGVARL